ncbi:MAG: enoyl-CoA hydratase/isomerase family protein [Patulibacter sp.]|nr:enoyl-CoA hydratase/isomerase family protein [Patulibacter sp.]
MTVSERTDLRCDVLAPGVARVMITRPERLNALTWDTIRALRATFAALDADDAVRAIVLAGEGRAFCAGLDLRDEGAFAPTQRELMANQVLFADTIAEMREMATPIIAAVHGPAAGGGLALALACDFRIATAQARFVASFVRIGLSGCDMGTSYLLPRIVGLGVASEILLTGRPVEAEEAVRIGLANQIVADDALTDEITATGRAIARNAPDGVAMTKEVVAVNVDAPSLRAALELENRTQVLLAGTPDQREAVAAFLERREPTFAPA